MRHVMVSSCLLGLGTRYDGTARPRPLLIEKLRGQAVIPVCPEQLGGLPTPRPRQHLVGGDGHAVLAGKARVVNERGEDVTESFVRAARETVLLARLFRVEIAYFKARSPACGCGLVDIEGTWSAGDGVTAAALAAAGVRVIPVE